MTFVTKWAPCNVIYAQQNKHKKSHKKSKNTKVAMLTWSTDDVFLSVFQWTNMQMLQRYFMLHPIIPCHSLVTYHCGHVITSTIPFTYEREGVLIGEFIHSRFSWTHRCSLVRSNWSCNASQLTSWSFYKTWMVILLFSHFTCRTTHWGLKQ